LFIVFICSRPQEDERAQLRSNAALAPVLSLGQMLQAIAREQELKQQQQHEQQSPQAQWPPSSSSGDVSTLPHSQGSTLDATRDRAIGGDRPRHSGTAEAAPAPVPSTDSVSSSSSLGTAAAASATARFPSTFLRSSPAAARVQTQDVDAKIDAQLDAVLNAPPPVPLPATLPAT
jgi:hypothetical protein